MVPVAFTGRSRSGARVCLFHPALACRDERGLTLNTDRWFDGVFQAAPELIRWLFGDPPQRLPMELE